MRSHAWIVALGALALPAQAQETPRPIYRIDIRGPLLHTLPGMLADALTQAGESDGVVLLVIDSPGGSGPALETSLTILDGATSPVYAIVEGRAWSTAALLALAADSVFLLADATIGGRMGGQTVSPERLAVLRAEFRSRLGSRGVLPAIGEAMIDPEVHLEELTPRGERLMLDAERAFRLGVADGRFGIYGSVIAHLGLDEAETRRVEPETEGALLVVENRNWQQVRIFLVREEGNRFRIGSVLSSQTREFALGPSVRIDENIQFAAEFIGSGRGIATRMIQVLPGLVVDWIIENNPDHSALFLSQQ